MRVPLVLRWPKRLPAGERRAQVVDLLDVAATMASALGGPALPCEASLPPLDVPLGGRVVLDVMRVGPP